MCQDKTIRRKEENWKEGIVLSIALTDVKEEKEKEDKEEDREEEEKEKRKCNVMIFFAN